MTLRKGHTRPVGTTWRMRLHSWDHDDPPALGDLVWEEPVELERGFLVVGVEETRDPTRWWLVLERMEWGELLLAQGRSWAFVRDRR